MFLKTLAIVSCLFFGGLNLYADQTPVKNDYLSYLLLKSGYPGYNHYVISPWRNWVLESVDNNKPDSSVISLLPFGDTTNRIHVYTFYPSDKSNFGVILANAGSGYFEYLNTTWSLLQDTVYLFVRGTTVNQTSAMECFAIDVSKYCSVIINGLQFTQYTKAIGLSKPVATPISVRAMPNPLQNEVKIDVDLAQKSFALINIYDSKGELIRVLGKSSYGPGTVSLKWDGKDYNGTVVANGVYYYQIVANDVIYSKKLIVIK